MGILGSLFFMNLSNFIEIGSGVMVFFSCGRTRVMQKLLEYLTTPEQVSIAMSALWPVTVALTKDTSGHHVIQHCLKLFSCQDNMVK